jgi:hypothetical protein
MPKAYGKIKSQFSVRNILNFDIYFPNYAQDIQRNAYSSSSEMSVTLPNLNQNWNE